jgi:23S rRNA pseudouridine1911/1915/1917 synthase
MSSFSELLDILHEDNHCIGINKPSGWPTTHFDGTDETVDRLVKSYLKEKHNKPGNVFLGVVHRLDKVTSGSLLFARTSKAASRLSEQFREGTVEKVYWAVIEVGKQLLPSSPWSNDSGSLDDFLFHDDDEHRVKIVDADTPGAKPARLLYTVRNRHAGMVWLELRPHTGRKHQLRVQLSARGTPIYGDTKYGSIQRLGDSIGLHARSLTFLHPTTNNPTTITAEVPKVWRGRFAKLLNG